MALAEIGAISYYIDDRLKKNLDKVRERVKHRDEDFFWIVDGKEGSGKSTFAFQLAKYVDPSFDLSRVVFAAKDFEEAILKAQKCQAVVFDEAFRGLSSRNTLGEVNKVLVELMMECRQKNLFVIIVLPTIFLLDRYAGLFRAKGLFHVYRKHGQRGYWMYFNEKKKQQLILRGRQNYSYSVPKTNFHGKFHNIYTIDEEAYRSKKRKALMDRGSNPRLRENLEQRNLLLWYLVNECKVSTVKLSDDLTGFGWKIAHNTISENVVRKEKELRKKNVIL